ncbi:DNA topoisomerase IB [Actinoplanes campanulatus]|uniref:DNA topoisomerase IB n=1 Tax=Actinoplanes campanulatus TaxID=113559 RepID=A0A7W5FFV0_9ACTN|nr:DNA topoisomerase IB [Actinoplanes campanulatus]GGN44599.1 hypothetical protein GCM10010109_77970 [Actinoplanes campanulatus]GID37408.1 hypothetical protein Aca09nite_39140 [Actinoplanes campanulatus]
MRLHRADLRRPGLSRRRAGSGFTYLDPSGAPLRDAETVARVRALVIPPAWRDVWICPDPRGHIQATGVDAAGRRQYLYHPAWREQQDRVKFDHALEVGARLPEVRDRIRADLTGRGLSRERVLAAIVRLLDMGMFRVGGEESAARSEDPSFGLSTLRPAHVRAKGGCVLLEYRGKSGVEHAATVGDGEVCAVLRDLKRRRAGEQRLFAYWDPGRRRWQEIRADAVNDYLREISGEQMTAKDFRTWHGTRPGGRRARRGGPAADRHETEEGRVQGHEGGGRAARQHPHRGPRLLRRPAGHRVLRERRRDRTRASGTDRGRGHRIADRRF